MPKKTIKYLQGVLKGEIDPRTVKVEELAFLKIEKKYTPIVGAIASLLFYFLIQKLKSSDDFIERHILYNWLQIGSVISFILSIFSMIKKAFKQYAKKTKNNSRHLGKK